MSHTPKRILVANRGEIALRVMRATREMGHIPLAIYSKADRQSLHVSRAEAAYCVGEGPSIHSYLRVDAVLEAAKAMNADAIHPGYGFLSENAAFAKAVSEAGMIFIGPSPEVIATMGDKVSARNTMEKAGLPLVPGTKEGTEDENKAFADAKGIGFPLMIKASAGGGGRGMRRVDKEEDFLPLFRRASSEAAKAFGDGRLYVEKFILSPHHIEVQIMADAHGNVVHLFERECSAQRRHQKVIEEAPSPYLKPDVRKAVCEAAVEACRNIGYTNAGTIEFLVDANQNFYFMEMNTRLQVEHPVTEWITGQDLAKEQIRVAFGQKLSFKQEDLRCNGHAFEFRIYAEDPEKFLPQAGLLRGASFPSGVGVRIDSHAYRGYEIPVFYDPMIAKISVWGRTREEAIERSKVALSETMLNGVKTNTPLHFQLLEHPDFVRGNYTTRMIEENFTFKQPEMDANRLEMAAISVAVSAFSKEFEAAAIEGDENSRWKFVARQEALR
ncbi:MAG: acetyl-CoA carboxylase biotin carboxylase subunit [Bdellovibrionales bacterium]|nr:acetyl-CoA carboxylase biotin carboxylase subunit [Bdellovibrionales bacterium]